MSALKVSTIWAKGFMYNPVRFVRSRIQPKNLRSLSIIETLSRN